MQVINRSIRRQDLENFCVQQGISAIHAGPWMRGIFAPYEKQESLLEKLPSKLIHNFHLNLRPVFPRIKEAHISKYDQSVKFLVELEDANLVEAVLMPERNRLTLCLSSQVGCAQGCVFCNTARMGLKRNLTSEEIVSQYILARDWLRQNPHWLQKLSLIGIHAPTNLVFMGMGEPLDNWDSLQVALENFTDQYAFGLAWKRISISTAGELNGIKKLYQRFPKARLALSLHTPFEEERSKWMPINKKFALKEVLEFLRQQKNSIPPVMIQYTLIHGRNDSLDYAKALAESLSGIDCKVNIIPFNPFNESRFLAPAAESLEHFAAFLHERKLRVLVRYSKGQDIAAACGQLVVRKTMEKH